MTSATAISTTRLLLDKYGSPYFTDSEILTFLNIAQLDALSEMVPDTIGGVVNFELDANITRNIAPLIMEIQSGYPTADGQGNTFITKTEIETNIAGGVSESAGLFAIISLSSVTSFSPYDATPIKFTKHNNIFTYFTNTFKIPSANKARYTISATGYKIYPTPSGSVYKMVVIRNPKIMTAINSPEWDDYVMNKVIGKAVKLAGIPLGDQELEQVISSTNIQSIQ